MGLLVVIIIVAIAVGAFFAWKKYKKMSTGSHGSSGSSGPGTPTCNSEGQPCGKCCLDTLTCKGGICVAAQSHPAIPAFFLTTGATNFGLGENGNIREINESPVWTDAIPSQFWFWDGISQIIIRSPHVGTNGEVTSMTNGYIIAPTSPKTYVQTQSTPSTGVTITLNGAIYSTDYSMCVSVDAAGNLFWDTCMGIPSLFDFITPSGCSNTGCNDSMSCCPPYNGCSAGMCSSCFGDPLKSCPDPATIAKCGEDSIWSCASKCGVPTGPCADNQTQVCLLNGDTYQWSCAWKCTGDEPSCGATNTPECTGSDLTGYSWECPYNACDHPPPAFNPVENPLSGYTWVTDHYESGNQPWKYPQWECASSTWSFIDGCNQSYKLSCPAGQKAGCSPDTSFQWSCLADTQYPDLCGMSTGTCGPDAACFDISTCDGAGTNTGNDWRWICPSSEGTTRCQIIKINGLAYPPLNINGTPDGVVTDVGGVPVYPTILNSQCRGAGSDLNHPDARRLIANPSASMLGSGTAQDPYTLFSGGSDASHVVTQHTVGDADVPSWPCVSDNPCQNGTYVPVSPDLEIKADSGVVTPPTSGELLNPANGHCECNPNFAGASCQLSNSVCSGAGVIAPCNTQGGKCVQPDGYFCTCNPNSYGIHCQFTPAMCSNSGIPNDQEDTLVCDCNPGFVGTTCQFTRASCSNNGTPQPGGSLTCVCDPGFVGPICASCQVSAPTPLSLTDGGTYSIQAYGMTGTGKFVAYLNFVNNYPGRWIYDVVTASQSAGNINYSPDGSTYGKYPGNSWVFTARKNPDGTYNLVIVDPNGVGGTSQLTNITVDSCGFIRSGQTYIAVSAIGNTSTVSYPTTPGTGCLYLVTPGNPVPSYNSVYGSYIVDINQPSASLGVPSGMLAMCDNPTCLTWSINSAVDGDGSLYPGTIESSAGGLVMYNGQPVANGSQLTVDPDSQGLQFTWDVINGGPISPASDPTLGLFTEQAFGVPTLTDIGSATHYMAVPNLTAM